MFIIAQLVGFVAMAGTITAFQINNRKKMLIILFGTSLLYTAHFLLLGAFTGAAMNGVNAVRNVVFYNKYEHSWARSNWWLALFIMLFVAFGVLTWQGWYSALPIIGMVVGAVAFWLKKPRYIRLVAITVPPFWFTYNYIVGSYPGMAVEIFTFTSIAVAMVRYDVLPLIKHKNEV